MTDSIDGISVLLGENLNQKFVDLGEMRHWH